MDPRVEIQPNRTLIVLGPHFAASLVKDDNEGDEIVSTLHPLSYTDFEAGSSDLSKWMQKNQQNFNVHRSSLLDRLLELQRDGALIVYGYIDQTVSTAAQQVALVSEKAEEWASGKTSGILHPFGVCVDPESIRLDISQECVSCLDRLLQERACIMLGYLDNQPDSCLIQLLQMCKKSGADLPLSLAGEAHCPSTNSILQLPMPDPTATEVICGIQNSTRKIGQLLEAPPRTTTNSSIVTLIMESKQGALEVSSLVKGSSFVFMNTVDYSGITLYTLCIRIDDGRLPEFWNWLVMEDSVVQLGGLGVALHKDVYIWLNSSKTIGTLAPGSESKLFLEPMTKTSLESSLSQNNSKDHHFPSRRSSPQKSGGRTIPRYTIQKFSHRNSLVNKMLGAQDDSSALLDKAPASILARRLSLPPIKRLPQPHLSKPGALVPNDFNASTRHTSLLSKFIFGRKSGKVPVGNHGSNYIKQLLKTKSENSSSGSSSSSRSESLSPSLDCKKDGATTLREMTIKRRRDLFVGEGQDWSKEIDGILVKLTKRWEKLRHDRMVAMMAKKQEEQIAQDNQLSDGTVRQHLASQPIALPSVAAYPNGIVPTSYMAGMNPYVLSQSAATSMLYPNFLSTYPLLATLPVNNFPYLLPTGQAMTAGMLLMQNGTGGVALPPSTGSLGTIKGNVSPVSTTVIRSPSPAKSQLAGTKRPIQQSTLQQAYPNISSLLQGPPNPPPAKRKSPSIHTKETSDDNSKNLWQFFLELLLAGSTYSHLLRWTGSNLEFKIENPEALARHWGQLTMNKTLSIDHLNQALYHYCTNTAILTQVNDQEATFRFHPSVATYINMHYMHGQSGSMTSINSNGDSNYKEILVVD